MKYFAILIAIFLTASLAHSQDKVELAVKTQDSPLIVQLRSGTTSCFMLPATILNVAVPMKDQKKLKIEMSPKTPNVFYATPQMEFASAVNFFVEAGTPPASIVYEFSVTAGVSGDYRHEIIVGKDPVTLAVEDLEKSLTAEHQAEVNSLTGGIDALIAAIRSSKKFKTVERTVYQDGLMHVRHTAILGDINLLETNLPAVALKSLQDAVWVNNYVLTRQKQFSVNGKEVKL